MQDKEHGMKKISLSIILILTIFVIGCSNQEKKVEPITSWKNEDKEVSAQEFKELTKSNNALEYKNGKFIIHDEDAVVKSQAGDVTTYFVQNAYIPMTDAETIIKKDKWTKREFLTQYIGAAQNITVNEKDKTVEVFFITGPRGYGELRVLFDGNKAGTVTNTF
ncbi:hypothetical protein [Listeria cornellensis]|uniref:hypothetical protein n=1 Tax=Listeria cornellensis TaxID=1494961 RepID=UPI0019D3D3CB|nr:hypothetical protein [Listeria cornellensis]